MPAINKEAFLKRIGEKQPADYGSVPGESATEDASPGEESSEGMTCGEQLMAGIENKDPAAIDAALQEAVKKYGGV